MPDVDFTTGPSTLPDVGELSYNGCGFSPLFETKVSGVMVKDKANRTVKCMEYTLLADGYATLPAGAESINGNVQLLRDLLSAQAGALVYRGRGFDLIVNGGSARKDVAWGPIPELLEFQPLGAGRSAKVQWTVKVTTTEPITVMSSLVTKGAKKIKMPPPPVLLQFNYDTSVKYGEDQFSSLSIKGTLEVAMTRPDQRTRTLTSTADDMRQLVENNIMASIDLTRFRLTQREFNVSRDKRTLEWNVTAEELPYMHMPMNCTLARGTYSVRPAKVGAGLALWLCTLRATYTVRADKPRRVAWLSFLALLRLRMGESTKGSIPTLTGEDEGFTAVLKKTNIFSPTGIISVPLNLTVEAFRQINNSIKDPPPAQVRAILIDFSFDEGLYLDSKTVSFSATWRLVTTFSHILLASGLWKKVVETEPFGGNLWALSMKDVSGAQSWLPNKLNPANDVIIDFGGP